MMLSLLLAATVLNPVIPMDYSDPDVIRAEDAYYLVASSFVSEPGLPILKSDDLVNWTIVSHALPKAYWGKSVPGNAVWAPSMREHAGKYYVFWGDPDRGIYTVSASRPEGPWSEPDLVKPGKGLIDPCPLFDDDGSVYLFHAFARSRAGINGKINVCRLDPKTLKYAGEDKIIYDGDPDGNVIIEGPKVYKRNGEYYLFAPAGGVEFGWQVVLRSAAVYGPYVWKRVLEQGSTTINGPHQGAWVDDWFLHFVDRGAFGRVTYLEPLAWGSDGWPVIGRNGEPMTAVEVPAAKAQLPFAGLQTSDDFANGRIGPQWQWEEDRKYLLQKFPGERFTATARIRKGAAVVVYGDPVVTLGADGSADWVDVKVEVSCEAAAEGKTFGGGIFRPEMPRAKCRFSVRRPGSGTFDFVKEATVKRSVWIGAKIGLAGVDANDIESSVQSFGIALARRISPVTATSNTKQSERGLADKDLHLKR